MYVDDSGIISLVTKCFGITNTPVQNSDVRILCTEVFAVTKHFINKFDIDVPSLLMSSLNAVVILQKYLLSTCKHYQKFYLIWYLHVESKHRTYASLCYLYNIYIYSNR